MQLDAEIVKVRAYVAEKKELTRDLAGLNLCSAYMPHRFATKNSDSDFSAVGAFKGDVRLRRALELCLKSDTPGARSSHLRSALTALNRTPSHFRPTAAHALVSHYTEPGDLVLDPCAGWGGRLMGTILAGRRYFGVDSSAKTTDCLHKLGTRICEWLALDRYVFEVVQGKFQEVSGLPTGVDFAMTSRRLKRKKF